MIYESVLRSVDDLVTRWTVVRDGGQTLATALVNDPVSQAIVNGWVTQSNTTIASIGTQRPSLLGFPGIVSLLTNARLILQASNNTFTPLNAAASALLPVLLASVDRQVEAAARNLESQLDSLRQLIEAGLQEFEEFSADEAARANLAGIRGSVDDISTYPILTQEFGLPVGPAPPTAPGIAGTAPLGQLVERTLLTVLGRRPRLRDTKSFIAALRHSFTCKEVQGHTVCTWTPNVGVGAAELGGSVTGAQASLYQRARSALDAVLPLLDRLTSLRPSTDPEEVDASRSIIQTEFTELVDELGVEGGPRAQRVNDLFELLLHQDFNVIENGLSITDPANAARLAEFGMGEVGRLGNVFDLRRDSVNTVEEEQNLTNYVVLRDHLHSLEASWQAFRPAFLGGVDTYLGTQLVLIERALSVAAETVGEIEHAMTSVFLGPAERQTVHIDFPAAVAPPMRVHELLSWVEEFASQEGPRIVRDGGKRGVRTIVPPLQRLRDLVRSADGRIQHPGARHPRVRRTLSELATHLDQAAHLAGTVR